MSYNLIHQAPGTGLNVVVAADATEYKPFILRGCVMYDPENEWKSINAPDGREMQLNPDYHEKAAQLVEEARGMWKSIGPMYVAPPAPREQTTLEKLVAGALAELTSDAVIATIKPQLDQYVLDTYGILPRKLEVKSVHGTYQIEGIVHERFQDVLTLVNCDIPVFLTGPAGSGKNVICKQAADALGFEFYFSNAVTQEYKLTGFIDAHGLYHETQFYKAFTNGGVFMLDEIDASTPEVLVILNAAIANKYFDFPTGRVDAHENFRLVAAGNTYGTGADIEYTGRNQLDAASLDRFAMVEIQYDPNIETAMSRGKEDLVDFVRAFRRAINDAKLKFVISYRAIDRLAKLDGVFSKADALRCSLLRGLSDEDARIVAKNLRIKNDYSEAFAKLVG